jgi:dienelactone hydrolase
MRRKAFRRNCAVLCCGAIYLLAGAIAGAQQHVQFPSTDSELTGGAPTKLEGYMYQPVGAGPFPAVVAMHNCAGLFAPRDHKLAGRTVDWGSRLSKLGYVVLFPDSFNPRGIREVCKGDQSRARPVAERIRDAYGALEYLQQQPFVRPVAIALLGWSHGAVTTLWASRRQTLARPKDLKTDFALGIALYPACAAMLEAAYTAAFPLHLFVGDRDDWTPAGPCKAFAEKAGVKLVAYPNAFHAFDLPNQAKLVVTGIRTPNGTGTVGTDPEARADVLKRVPEILATMPGR